MPTKCSIAHGADFRLYSDVFDEGHVFLRLDSAAFAATPGGATAQIPLHIWEFLRSFPGTVNGRTSKRCWRGSSR